MVSKSQARWFFVGGTVFFTGIFVFLTIHTLRGIPARQNQDRMTESVVRGQHSFDRNNCMGYHTILGEGAYYAPELTKVVERRSAHWSALFLEETEVMLTGRRRIINYDFSEQDIQDVNAFLRWIGSNDLLKRTGDLRGVVGNAVTNISRGIDNLIGTGAENILVMNVPNLGISPIMNGQNLHMNGNDQPHNFVDNPDGGAKLANGFIAVICWCMLVHTCCGDDTCCSVLR